MPKQKLAKLHLVKNPREYIYLTKVTEEGGGGGREGGGEGRGKEGGERGGGEGRRRKGREGREERRGKIEGSIMSSEITHTHTHLGQLCDM